jgi:hypothetical protein
VPGKTSKYDPKFNNISVFYNSKLFKLFKEYSLQDSIALYQALIKAQEIYFNDYIVDIAESVSSSSLSLKIFRVLFLKTEIPILKGTEDSFIRKGYFGGHTDYYKAYATKVKYYDVNSLYPSQMLKDIPHKLIKFYKNMDNIKLDDFFGFCLCEVTTPKNILKPLLPYKHNNKTIYPTGSWIGVYFSEELKAVVKHGYQIKLLKGYEFSKMDLFSEYVDHFYGKKSNSTGAQRWIAKMHLNQLYGIFGRRKDTIQTFNVNNKDIPDLLTSKIVKTIIEINDNISTVLVHNNLNIDMVKKLNISFETDFVNPYVDVKSNVAIAAAVTSYARIHMIPFILNPGTVYTDTDSAFIEGELDPMYVGKGLGLMKDELNGLFINEAYFLGIKRYGYYYFKDNIKIEQSVFAGIVRNSLSFDDIIKLYNGKTLTRTVNNRFYKSFEDLTIRIKDVNIQLNFKTDKTLKNNIYYPLNIFNLNHNLDSRSIFLKIKNKIIKLIKHYVL